jgi:hypothetical protein
MLKCLRFIAIRAARGDVFRADQLHRRRCVCPTPGAVVSTALVQANSTAKAIEANSRAGFFIFAITFR